VGLDDGARDIEFEPGTWAIVMEQPLMVELGKKVIAGDLDFKLDLLCGRRRSEHLDCLDDELLCIATMSRFMRAA
jgi:hypothetical protein